MAKYPSTRLDNEALQVIQELHEEIDSERTEVIKKEKQRTVKFTVAGLLTSLILLLLLVIIYGTTTYLTKNTAAPFFIGSIVTGIVIHFIGTLVGKLNEEQKLLKITAIEKKICQLGFIEIAPLFYPSMDIEEKSIYETFKIENTFLLGDNSSLFNVPKPFNMVGKLDRVYVDNFEFYDEIAPIQTYIYSIGIFTNVYNQKQNVFEGIGISIPHNIPIRKEFLIKPNYKKIPINEFNNDLYQDIDINLILTDEPIATEDFDDFMLGNLVICENEDYQKQILQSNVFSLFYQLSIVCHDNIHLAVTKEHISFCVEFNNQSFWKKMDKTDEEKTHQQLFLVKKNLKLLNNLILTVLRIKRMLPTMIST